MNENNSTKKGCWGCFGIFFIIVGIIQLIISIIMFNPIFFVWALVSTGVIMVWTGGKIQKLDEVKNVSEEKTEVSISQKEPIRYDR